MNLGQLIGELMFAREEVRAAPAMKVAMPKKKKKSERILDLLRTQAMTLSELHDKIGGSRASLSVFLSGAKASGEVEVSGSNRHYLRYSVKEGR